MISEIECYEFLDLIPTILQLRTIDYYVAFDTLLVQVNKEVVVW